MAVHAPGRSPLPRIFRPARSARALPSTVPFGPGRRRVAATLSMTSLIDVMVVSVVFLLATFSARSECGGRHLSRLPESANVREVVDAPMVFVDRDGVSVDGVAAERRDALVGAAPRRLDETFRLLAAKHDVARRVGGAPPTHVILAIEGDVPAGVVKSVTRTVVASGYTDVDFLVNAAPPRATRD